MNRYRIAFVAVGLLATAGCMSEPTAPPPDPNIVLFPAQPHTEAVERAQQDRKEARAKVKLDAAMAAKRRRDDAEAKKDEMANGTVDPSFPKRALNAATADREKQEAGQQSGTAEPPTGKP